MSGRSCWKVPFVDIRLKLIKFSSVLNRYNLKRGVCITLGLLNKKIGIYNGRKFVSFKIGLKHLGLKLGEFSFSKVAVVAKKKMKMKKGLKKIVKSKKK